MHHGERFNSLTHLAGLLLAVAGAVVLLGRTLPQGDAARSVAAAVFALSMVALYAASTLFHSTRGRARRWWQRADHCAIYGLIAGTYTPFALVTLQGPVGWALLAGIWSVAAFGIAREWRGTDAAAPSLRLYIGMGWLGVFAAAPLAARLDRGGLAWLLAGAVLYTAGTVFYRNRRGWPHAHGLWHLFVLGGTACHFVAVAGFVL
ncbi:MAG: hemolysin III family protein [Comamonadaceae bacterium]|nr:MAG: hemolysin III family protein [Comamonadaceae bacterium]